MWVHRHALLPEQASGEQLSGDLRDGQGEVGAGPMQPFDIRGLIDARDDRNPRREITQDKSGEQSRAIAADCQDDGLCLLKPVGLEEPMVGDVAYDVDSRKGTLVQCDNRLANRCQDLRDGPADLTVSGDEERSIVLGTPSVGQFGELLNVLLITGDDQDAVSLKRLFGG